MVRNACCITLVVVFFHFGCVPCRQVKHRWPQVEIPQTRQSWSTFSAQGFSGTVCCPVSSVGVEDLPPAFHLVCSTSLHAVRQHLPSPSPSQPFGIFSAPPLPLLRLLHKTLPSCTTLQVRWQTTGRSCVGSGSFCVTSEVRQLAIVHVNLFSFITVFLSLILCITTHKNPTPIFTTLDFVIAAPPPTPIFRTFDFFKLRFCNRCHF